MVTQVLPYLYDVNIVLPGSPLKNLNVYVIKGSHRNMIVDTGFNIPECLKSLREGLSELNLDMSKTDIFVTHLHADHCGLVPDIASKDSTIYMSEIDYDILSQTLVGREYWGRMSSEYTAEGFPPHLLKASQEINPARQLVARELFPVTYVSDGTVIDLGDVKFQCVLTPGHTPGHMCLYNSQDKIFISGDHILFDITPNITAWPDHEDSLNNFLMSLEKVRSFDVEIALAGHRQNDKNFYTRIDELIDHHEKRLSDALNIVKDFSPITCYDAAAKMKWSIRAKDWDDFPLQQKWFAVGETAAHLYHLRDQGKICCKVKDGIRYYSITE